MAGAVRVSGLREATAALKKIDRKAPKIVTDELKQAAEPVADAARAKISRYQGARLNTIKPRATTSSVRVRQNARKRGGHRGDFGRLQQRHFEDALDENTGQIVRDVERALDRLTNNF